MIIQLPSPCTVPSWDGDDRSDAGARYGSHYESPAKLPAQAALHNGCNGLVVFALDGWCLTCGAEGLGEGDYEIRVIVPRTLATCCWVAACDGECGQGYEDEETGAGAHSGAAGTVERTLRAEGWSVRRDGRVYCPADAPWDGSPEVPAVLPGQGELGFGERR